MQRPKEPENNAQAKSPAVTPDTSGYRTPRLFVVGSTKRTLQGHHGSGQESGGYAPKPKK